MPGDRLSEQFLAFGVTGFRVDHGEAERLGFGRGGSDDFGSAEEEFPGLARLVGYSWTGEETVEGELLDHLHPGVG